MGSNDRSRVDELILKHARKSPEEISALVGGVGAEWVAERRSELLGAKDTLTVAQQEVLLLEELDAVKDTLLEVLEHAKTEIFENGGKVEDFASVARVVNQSLKEIGTRLDQRKKVVTTDIERITSAQGQLLGSVVDIAVGHLLSTLKTMYPDTSDAELDLILTDGMRKAKGVLNERVSE
jgi:hypothetical protein